MSKKPLEESLKTEAFYRVFTEGTAVEGKSLYDTVMDKSIVDEDTAEGVTVAESVLGKEHGFEACEDDEGDTLDIVRGTLNNTLEELYSIVDLAEKHR